MIKRITKYFSFLLLALSGIILGTTQVHAVASKGDIISGKYVSGPYYVIHEKSNGSHMWLQAQFINRTSDGQFVYCVQPYFTIKEDNTYNITTEDYAAVLNMSRESWEQISRLAYYGYGYKDDNYDHTADKWYIATQMLIWNIADPSIDSYFTNTLKGTRNDNILKAEMDEVLALANSHKVLPNLVNFPSSMNIGQTVTINDTNNVLSKFDITNVQNGNVSKNGNSLNITANNVGNLSFQIEKLGNRYGNVIELYYASDSQNVMHRGNLDPISIKMNVNVIGGKVELHKVDSENNKAVAQGEGLLSNAKYGVYNNNGNLIQTLTTDSKGYAISDYLASTGTFYIQEISPSVGYKLDSEKHYFEINANTLLANVTSKEVVVKGKIKITKQDSQTKSCKAQGEATLIGAKYGVYDKNGTLVDTLTIGNDCTATSKDLPYGNYKVKEISASTGYYIDNNTYDANINEVKTINITSNENVITTKVKITKNDSETKTCQAQGDAKLEGAKYGVYDHNGNLVDTLVTKGDCTAVSKDLPYGRYTIKELEPSEGYYIDKKVYSINVVNNTLIEVISYEDVIKNYISILKQYDFVDGNTTFLNAESNISFEIYNSKGNLYSTIKTDKNGYASINLPYGIWKFHQVNTTTGYEKIYDYYVTVNKESNLEQYYNILNNSISAYLQVIKVDSETGERIALANTTFKIFNKDTNQYVSQFVGGKVYSEFKTDDEGKVVTYLKLQSGNYKLIETASPKGYVINKDGVDFTIGNDTHFSYTTYGAFITLEYKNTPIKGQIELSKNGEKFAPNNGEIKYDSIKLENIKFEIYAKEDILSSDGNHLYFNKGDLVDTIKTDKNGYAISKLLPLGKYYVIEVETNTKYVLDDEEHEIELTEEDNMTSVVYGSLMVKNKLNKGDLVFTKTELTTGKVIPNTKLEIYTENDELIYTGITDEKGQIKIEKLPLGKYYIIETEAATGYRLSDEKVYFEIKENNEVVKASMTNEKKKGKLEFTKEDFSTSETLPNTLIEIYNENDELVFSGRTNEDGKIVIEELEYGKYYILEKEAPEGYYLNEEKMYFEILEDGEIVKCTMKDEKVIIDVPNTEENSYIIPISLILMGIATGVVIYEEVKKRKNKNK